MYTGDLGSSNSRTTRWEGRGMNRGSSGDGRGGGSPGVREESTLGGTCSPVRPGLPRSRIRHSEGIVLYSLLGTAVVELAREQHLGGDVILSKAPKDVRERDRLSLAAKHPIAQLLPRDEEGSVRVVIESPRGSSVKITWEPELCVFTYSRSLIPGLVFPFDFGFVPGTKASDGDPLDALVLHEGATFPGVIISCRLLGILEIEQSEKGKRIRNDRLVCIPRKDAQDKRMTSQKLLSSRRKREIEEFFRACTLFEGKNVEIVRWGAPEKAERRIDALSL